MQCVSQYIETAFSPMAEIEKRRNGIGMDCVWSHIRRESCGDRWGGLHACGKSAFATSVCNFYSKRKPFCILFSILNNYCLRKSDRALASNDQVSLSRYLHGPGLKINSFKLFCGNGNTFLRAGRFRLCSAAAPHCCRAHGCRGAGMAWFPRPGGPGSR